MNERIAWLAENRTEDQLERFLAGLNEVRERIERNPRAAPTVRQDDRYVLRMRLFPRPLPYLVYYAHERAGPISQIYLVRIYGSGQNRPEFDMSEWPW